MNDASDDRRGKHEMQMEIPFGETRITLGVKGPTIVVGETTKTDDDDVVAVCSALKEVLHQLSYPRRKEILSLLSPGTNKTFEELKAETGISTGSLHHHLTELCRAVLVSKDSQSWPHKYSRSSFLGHLLESFAENLEKAKVSDEKWFSLEPTSDVDLKKAFSNLQAKVRGKE